MSLFSNGIFGRKRSESKDHHQTWHPSYQTHNGYEVSQTNTNTPYVTTPPYHNEPSPYVNTQIEWKETHEAHVYKAHLPGIKKSDVRVEVDDDRVLCIICEKNVEMEEQRGGWHRVEVASGRFVQRLTLPENSKVDHVKAYMDNGVLTIHVPKHRVVMNQRVRNVQISHA